MGVREWVDRVTWGRMAQMDPSATKMASSSGKFTDYSPSSSRVNHATPRSEAVGAPNGAPPAGATGARLRPLEDAGHRAATPIQRRPKETRAGTRQRRAGEPRWPAARSADKNHNPPHRP